MIEEKHIFKCYNFFYFYFYKTKEDYTEKNQILCKNFLVLLENRFQSIQRLGIDFLWFYFVFQFEYWKNLNIKSYNKKIKLQFIVGKKAFTRYLERDSNYDWQIIQDSRTYDRVFFNKTLSLYKIEKSNYDPDELYKSKKFNTEKGFIECMSITTLYNKSSNYCISCNFQDSCRKIQRKLYPKIYLERGNGKTINDKYK